MVELDEPVEDWLDDELEPDFDEPEPEELEPDELEPDEPELDELDEPPDDLLEEEPPDELPPFLAIRITGRSAWLSTATWAASVDHGVAAAGS